MKKDLSQFKKKIVPLLRDARVIKASLFGSYVRGEEREDSDVDILVEVPKGTGLFRFIELHLVTFKSIHPLLRGKILKEQVPVL